MEKDKAEKIMKNSSFNFLHREIQTRKTEGMEFVGKLQS